MPRPVAAITIIVTTLLFTVVGVIVGYLISSTIHPWNSVSNHPTMAEIEPVFLAYILCTAGGFIAGLVLSCFAVWLIGTKKAD